MVSSVVVLVLVFDVDSRRSCLELGAEVERQEEWALELVWEYYLYHLGHVE